MKILFVCMGNICRSPAAEGVFRKMAEDAGLANQLTIDSAGTHGYHEGDPADSRMRRFAKERGYDLTSRARQIRQADLDEFDLILVADSANRKIVDSMARSDEHRAKIAMITDYHPADSINEVPDPYYGGDAGFIAVMDLLEKSMANLLNEVRRRLDSA